MHAFSVGAMVRLLLIRSVLVGALVVQRSVDPDYLHVLDWTYCGCEDNLRLAVADGPPNSSLGPGDGL